MQTLKGKKAVITGAGKGLGKAMALALAAEGVELALLGRSSQNLQQVAEETQQINPDLKTKTYVADVSDYTQVREQVKALPASSGLLMVPITSSRVTATAGKKTGARMVAGTILLFDFMAACCGSWLQ